MTFQARYPRLLAALVLVSSPVWFLPVILFQTLRYSGYAFRELGSNVRWAAESIFLDLSIEFGIALGRIREAYDASIGSFVAEARKRTVWAWQTGKLLATIGLQRTLVSLSAFFERHVAYRLTGALVVFGMPLVLVWCAARDFIRENGGTAAKAARAVGECYVMGLKALATGKDPS